MTNRTTHRTAAALRRSVVAAVCLTALAAAAEQPQRLEILVEKKAGGEWEAAPPETVFETDELIRFRAAAGTSGYLYITNKSTSGQSSLIYPAAGQHNWIETNQEISVPGGENYFRISGPPGFDVMHWIVSPVKLNPQDAAPAAAPAKQAQKPVELIPRCDETLHRTRGGCLDPRAGVRPAQDAQKVLEDFFAPQTGERTRQLQLQPGETPARLEAHGSGEAPLVFEFRLAHR